MNLGKMIFLYSRCSFFLILTISIFFSCINEVESIKPQPKDGDAVSKDSNSSMEGVHKEGYFLGQKITYLEKNEEMYFNDDILIHPSQLTNNLAKSSGAGRNHLPSRWPSNVVYFDIHSSLFGDARITDALNEIERNTNVRFIQRSNQSNHIRFVWHPSVANSYVGMVGGRQDINIPNWASMGTVMHEIYHALGVFHEQTRQDRDDHVVINWNNIEEDAEHNFQTYNNDYYGFDYEIFDWNSIMLYSSYAFSRNGLPTIERVGGGTFNTQRSRLSIQDIETINEMYPPLWRGVPGKANDVGVGANGGVWVIGNTSQSGGYTIHNWNGNSWARVGGGAIRIDVDNAGNPWIVNNQGTIYRRNGSGWDQAPGKAHDIGCGADGSVWIIGKTPVSGGYSIHRWNGTGWTRVSGGALRITVDQNGIPYIVNSLGYIYRWVRGDWVRITGKAVDIGAGPNNTIYCLGVDWENAGGYNVHKWVGNDWIRIPGNLTSIDVGPGGVPWGTNGLKNIYTK